MQCIGTRTIADHLATALAETTPGRTAAGDDCDLDEACPGPADAHGEGARGRSWPGPGCDKPAPEALLLVPRPAILAITRLAGRDLLRDVHPGPSLPRALA
jgi:hypothetical protein